MDHETPPVPTPTPERLASSSKLLAALPRAEYRRLLASLEPITLAFGEVLYESGDAIRYVYFPNNALVSLLTSVDPPLALEVGMVGREGLVGISLALGVSQSPVRALVQSAGTAMRMKAAPFRRELRRSVALQRQVGLYAHELMIQIAQTAACNRFHVVEARLARWLLMTRDRVGSDHFHLTHEFIGHMLGVRRVGVTNAAHALKQRGQIDYSRGNIDIIDGAGLEASACSCYRRAKDSYRA